MKILYIAAQLYLPQLYGGVQTSTDQLCRALAARGHKVSLLVKLMPGGFFGFRARLNARIRHKLTGAKVAKDRGFGYTIWRAWFPLDAIDYVCRREKPDLIVAMTGGEIMPLALHARRTGIPMLVQLHDVAINEYGEAFDELGTVPCVANSHFTAQKYAVAYGVTPSVIYPFTALDRYKTATTRENVTFINPVQVKGVDLALAIARQCPEIPFSFIEGWTLSHEQRAALVQKLAELPNVILLPSADNMRSIYGKCKILLVPSTYEETFGRVVTEAQINGIPVIASDRGGLPETVGAGGIVLNPDNPVEEWATALRKLWQDETYYAALSAAALQHAQRPEMGLVWQIATWERAFRDAINPSGASITHDKLTAIAS